MEMNGDAHIESSALSWLRETDTLTVENIKRAVWEDLRCDRIDDTAVCVSNHSYADPSEHTSRVETVDTLISSCTCPDFEYRGRVCKHMIRVAIEIDRGDL